MPTINNKIREGTSGLIELFGYLDDTVGACEGAGTVARLAFVLQREERAVGQVLDPRKCLLWGPGATDVGVVRAEREGIVLLGAAVGTADFVRAHLDGLVARARGAVELLLASSLDLPVKWAVLSVAGMYPRLALAARVTAPDVFRPAALAADAITEAALRVLLGEVGGARFPAGPLGFPERFGGLGLGSLAWSSAAAHLGALVDALRPDVSASAAGPASGLAPRDAPDAAARGGGASARRAPTCACRARARVQCSRASCAVCCALGWDTCVACPRPEPPPWLTAAPSYAGALRAYAAVAQVPVARAAAAVAVAAGRAHPQRALSAALWGRLSERLHAGSGLAVRAHLHAAADPLARAWLRVARFPAVPMPPAAFRVALRTRLGLPVLDTLPPRACRCSVCGAAERPPTVVGSAADAAARMCKSGPWCPTNVHAYVRDDLFQWLRHQRVPAWWEPEDAAPVAG